MKQLKRVLCALAVCIATHVGAVTIYVDASAPGPGDGSAGDPYTTIEAGVLRLSNENAIVAGGHVVLVKQGTYNETVALGDEQGGTNNAHNTILGENNPIISGTRAFQPSADWIIIDGFTMRGSSLGAIHASSGLDNSIVRNCVMDQVLNGGDIRQGGISLYVAGDNLVVSNCVFIDEGSAMNLTRGSPRVRFDGCTIVDNFGWGFKIGDSASATAEITITNCIVFGTGHPAFYRRDGKFIVRNSLIYGTGAAACDDSTWDIYYGTQEELNSLAGDAALDFSNIVVAAPGFSDLNDNWNVNEFYADSPCLKANSGFNADMGAYHNPPTVAISANTYYVDASTGDDGRSAAQATSESTPWATIARAAGDAVAGDTVIVKAGTYNESILLTNSSSGSSILSFIADGDVTVSGGAYGFQFLRTGGVVLDGFHVTGATDGILLTQSMGNTIRNGSCYGNTDGIQLNKSPGNVIDNMDIYSNSSCGLYGLASRPSGSLLSRSRIHGNNVGFDVRNFHCCWRLENCNFYTNITYGIYMYYAMYSYYAVDWGGAPNRVENCDVVGNGDNGIFVRYGIPRIINSVVVSNSSGVWEYDASADASLAYDCFQGNGTNFYDEGSTVRNTAVDINAVSGCSNNIVDAPRFVSYPESKLKLQGNSSCIDAGSPTTSLGTDMYGNERLSGSAVDIGSYEVPPKGVVISCW